MVVVLNEREKMLAAYSLIPTSQIATNRLIHATISLINLNPNFLYLSLNALLLHLLLVEFLFRAGDHTLKSGRFQIKAVALGRVLLIPRFLVSLLHSHYYILL